MHNTNSDLDRCECGSFNRSRRSRFQASQIWCASSSGRIRSSSFCRSDARLRNGSFSSVDGVYIPSGLSFALISPMVYLGLPYNWSTRYSQWRNHLRPRWGLVRRRVVWSGVPRDVSRKKSRNQSPKETTQPQTIGTIQTWSRSYVVDLPP